MSDSYKKQLNKVTRDMGAYARSGSKVMPEFMKMHHAGTQDGALSVKDKELIALGIGIYARCDGCILAHTAAALEAGATREEIIETIDTAVYMGGGPCVIYGSKAFGMLEEFLKK
jgi:AhpD family alkylhydroperoxidase